VPTIELETVDNAGQLSGPKVSIPISALLMIGSPARQSVFSPLAVLDGDWKWSLHRLQGSTPRVKAKTDLSESFSNVAAVTTMADLSVVGGSDPQDRPVVCVFDASLEKVAHVVLPSPSLGVVSSVASLQGALVLTVNATDDTGRAWLFQLSPQLRTIRNVELSGGAASLTSRNADVFISYSGKDGEVFAQLFDEKLQSRWKTRVLTREGVTTGLFHPVILSQGFALVGANHGRLAVTRLSRMGKLLQAREDTRSELLPPNGGYRIVADGDQLNILGMARRMGGAVTSNETSFRFQDLP
jgi:hypothetical protein